jgi:N-acetylglucosamine-6-phosphate deacetylase
MKFVEGNAWTPDGRLETVKLAVDCGKIQDIQSYAEIDRDVPMMMPGFIDVHVHGGGGADTMDASQEAFATMTQTHAHYGTTSLLLTTVTESPEQIHEVLRVAQAYMRVQHGGATVVGVHLEGPFIHPERAGAQRPDMIIDPNVELADAWFQSGIVKMMTLAPERPGAHDVARLAKSREIVVSVGHTQATSDDLTRARDAGFSHVTHLCNAMRPFLHRDVGPIGHVVEDESYTADFICDGIHIHPAMLKVLLAGIGHERLMLITDAIRATGLGDGLYDLGGLPIKVEHGTSRLQDGTLAGSVLTMAQAVTRVQRLAGVAPFVAQQLASANPAKRLGLLGKGALKVGFDADLVCMNAAGDVLKTMVGGEWVYDRQSAIDMMT